MSRRRGSTFTFDLEPDEPGAPDEPGDAGEHDVAGPSWVSRGADRLRRVRGRTWAVTAGVAAAAVVLTGAGVAAAGAHAERERVTALAAAPGGILDAADVLGGPPDWSVDTDTGVLAVLPDGVVVTRDGADVLAVDVATGEERWRRTLGADVNCGPSPGTPAEAAIPVDQVVCLSGDAADRLVTVLGADGEVRGSRELGDVSDLVVAPAAGGRLVVVEQEGTIPRPRTFPDEEAALQALSDLADGPGAEVRFEDALTGEVRGGILAEFDRRLSDFCLNWVGDGVQIDFDTWSLQSSPVLVDYRRCGIDVSWVPPSVDPDALPDLGVGAESDDWDSRLWSADGGLVLRRDAGDRLRQVGGTGDLVLPGRLLDPAATDGAPGPRLVASAAGISALDPDDLGGDPRWELPWPQLGSSEWPGPDQVRSTQLLVRTRDTAVVQDVDGELVGLDVADGTERWRVPAVVDGLDEDRFAYGVVTDGRSMLVVVTDQDGGDVFVPVDLGTGEVGEEVAGPAILDGLPLTVDGHLVLRVSDEPGATTVGADGVARSPGSLQGWGGA